MNLKVDDHILLVLVQKISFQFLQKTNLNIQI